jgi:molybdopterin-guanine dinucleotide biosynthesis protein A
MGRDKGQLAYAGVPQALRAFAEVGALCETAYLSVRAEQHAAAAYAGLPQLLDEPGVRGPVAGLLAAWARHPGAAWLVVAADMPFVTRELLAALVRCRDPAAPATAYRHADGTVEPLCTIWEPAARDPVAAQVRAGDASLRRFLDRAGVVLLDPAEPTALRSVDTWAEYAAARAELGDPAAD